MPATRSLYCYSKKQRLEDLCTTCWNPSMMRVTVVYLKASGVGETTRDFCVDCRRADATH